MEMTDALLNALTPLKELEGVYGSFLLGAAGELLARDVPLVLEDQQLRQAGMHLTRLWGAAARSQADQVTLEFAAHFLYCRRPAFGTLCVFVASRECLPAVRGATRMVCAELAESGLSWTAPRTTLWSTADAGAEGQGARAVEPARTNATRPLGFLYRGRRLEP
jgi:hypothetical protein